MESKSWEVQLWYIRMNVVDVKSSADFDVLAQGFLVVHFWADWAEQCKQIDTVLAALQQIHQQEQFITWLIFFLCLLFSSLISNEI